MAILGASGAGKTSLLNVLAGTSVAQLGLTRIGRGDGHVSGKVMVNGVMVLDKKYDVSNVSGYVLQVGCRVRRSHPDRMTFSCPT